MNIILLGCPITKKNHQKIVTMGKRMGLVQSDAYRQYEEDCLWQLSPRHKQGIDWPVNVKCVYFMQTRRRVDLVNLLEATNDILVKGGVLADDNSSIVVGHDGSRVLYDKLNPRVEIDITKQEE